MPLHWTRGRNPFVHSYFGRLKLGPNANPRQIVGREADLSRQISNGKEVTLANVRLDAHAISEAKSMLLNRETLAEEMLLVHPQPVRTQSHLKERLKQLEEAVTLPRTPPTVGLKHPLAIYWFLPQPGPDVVERPPLAALGLVSAGQDPDLDLDVVFDQ